MSTPNNPAGRLHLILQRAQSLGEKLTDSSIKVWPQVLLCASDTPRDVLLARIARVQELPTTVNIHMRKVPDLEAIDDYHVVGIESFVRTTESIIGAAVCRSDRTQEMIQSQFGERFKQVLGTCIRFAGKYATVRPLLGDAVKLLGEAKNLLPL